jgi:hypothetical protein
VSEKNPKYNDFPDRNSVQNDKDFERFLELGDNRNLFV